MGKLWDALKTHTWGIWGDQTSWKKLNVSGQRIGNGERLYVWGSGVLPGPGTQLVSLLGLSSLLKAGITVTHAWT